MATREMRIEAMRDRLRAELELENVRAARKEQTTRDRSRTDLAPTAVPSPMP